MKPTYRVNCYRNGNRRGRPLTYYIRAANPERAEQAGRELSGLRVAVASLYRPECDVEMQRFVQVTNKEPTNDA